MLITLLKRLRLCSVQSIKWAHRALWIDLCIYVVFLLSFLLAALVPFVSIAWDGHMFISIFTKYAAQLEWPDPSNTFQDIHSVADFWSWWKGPMRYAHLHSRRQYADLYAVYPLPRLSSHVLACALFLRSSCPVLRRSRVARVCTVPSCSIAVLRG